MIHFGMYPFFPVTGKDRESLFVNFLVFDGSEFTANSVFIVISYEIIKVPKGKEIRILIPISPVKNRNIYILPV